MELEKVTVAIRPRSPWETLDLGILLVREFKSIIFPVWIFVALTTFAILYLVTAGNLALSMFLFWWFKPAYDRLLLRILSRALFGTPTTAMESLRSLKEIFSSGLWINLTLLRLNPSRSFHLPVWALEGLRGKPRVSRIRTLSSNIRSYPVWLTIACQSMEFVFQLSPLILLAFLMPQGINHEFIGAIFFGEDAPLWIEISTSLFFYLSIVLIEPIYVASGFMLYIDRRTKLEGWDIELAFRRMAKRLNHLTTKIGPTTTFSLLLILVITSASLNSELHAAPGIEQSRQTIEQVMQEQGLNRSKKFIKWKPRWEQDKIADTRFLTKLKAVVNYLAHMFRGAIWLLVIGAVILLVFYRDKWLDVLGELKKRKPTDNITELFGMSISRESLPDNVQATAENYIDSGDIRSALSLLYRASLIHLLEHDGLKLHKSHTEGDVLLLVKNALSTKRGAYFNSLTHLWKDAAYSHHQPNPDSIRAICRDWQQHFPTFT